MKQQIYLFGLIRNSQTGNQFFVVIVSLKNWDNNRSHSVGKVTTLLRNKALIGWWVLTNENALFQSRIFRITLAPLRWWLKGDTSPSPTGHPYPDFDPCTTSSWGVVCMRLFEMMNQSVSNWWSFSLGSIFFPFQTDHHFHHQWQCDQIGRFIALCATIQSLWQHLIYPNLLPS